ncbi:MAG: ABC transporter ATP-binding protein [Anaerolineales bacterium]|jgi:peptide/nickel transport system ATP-binding protein
MSSETILDVRNLKTYYATDAGMRKVVDGFSFQVKKGRVLGLAGPGGSGKTTVALSVMRLIAPPGKIISGEIFFKGRDLLKLPERELAKLRGLEISIVFQDASSYMDPLYVIGDQLMETIQAHSGATKEEARKRGIELLTRVGIPDAVDRMKNFPHQFSGGMQQRALIAMAIANNPTLLILDDPTRSLDVTIQAQVIQMLVHLREQTEVAILLISSNVALMSQFADDIVIIFGGRCIEMGPKNTVLGSPHHPYTRSLLEAIPVLEGERLNRLKVLPESRGLWEGNGCVWYSSCQYRMGRCALEVPQLAEVGEGHYSACFLGAHEPHKIAT